MTFHARIKPNGRVDLWESFVEEGQKITRQVELAAMDALHALKVDPERWSLDRPDKLPAKNPGGRGN